MASEPRISLKSVTGRLDLTDYAKVIQMVDTFKADDGTPIYKDVSHLLRCAIGKFVQGVRLDKQHMEWIEIQKQKNIDRRKSRRTSFFSRIRKAFRG